MGSAIDQPGTKIRLRECVDIVLERAEVVTPIAPSTPPPSNPLLAHWLGDSLIDTVAGYEATMLGGYDGSPIVPARYAEGGFDLSGHVDSGPPDFGYAPFLPLPTMPDALKFLSNSQFTLEYSVKLPSDNSNDYFIFGTQPWFYTIITGTSLLIKVGNGSGWDIITFTDVISRSEWNAIKILYNAGVWSLYVNDILIPNVDNNYPLNDSFIPPFDDTLLVLGCHESQMYGPESPFYLKEIKVYSGLVA